MGFDKPRISDHNYMTNAIKSERMKGVLETLLDKFPDGLKRYQTDALFHKVICTILSTSDNKSLDNLLNIINDLLEIISNQQNQLKEILENSTHLKVNIEQINISKNG